MKFEGNTDPTIEEVLVWAYDVDIEFIEQDEDLILWDPKYITPLLKAASDITCPKRENILSILYNYSQVLFVRKELDLLDQIFNQLSREQDDLEDKVENWRSIFLKLYNLIKSPHPITEEECDMVAWQLCVGDYCLRDFAKHETNKDGYIRYTGSCPGFTRNFFINPTTGHWI